MNICIIGANGLLGRSLLSAADGDYNLSAADMVPRPEYLQKNINWYQLDITDSDQVRDTFMDNNFDYIVNTAALTDVDYCEDVPEKAYSINAIGAGNVARAAEKSGSKLVHISTDYVFDGTDGPYTEDDDPNPLSVYGKSKYAGEHEVLDSIDNAVIMRTMILYGYSAVEKLNFVTWLIKMLRNNTPVSIVNDQYGTPTYADDLADAILSLITSGEAGLFHATGPENLNRYNFALKIADIFNLDKGFISETTSNAFVQKAKRPLRSGLICDKLAAAGYRFPALVSSLADMKLQMERAA